MFPRRLSYGKYAMAIPCPLQPREGSGANCLLSTFGSDGAGRRMEAAMTCVAAAYALSLIHI